jgi:hypothetical protein
MELQQPTASLLRWDKFSDVKGFSQHDDLMDGK